MICLCTLTSYAPSSADDGPTRSNDEGMTPSDEEVTHSHEEMTPSDEGTKPSNMGMTTLNGQVSERTSLSTAAGKWTAKECTELFTVHKCSIKCMTYIPCILHAHSTHS